MNVAWQIVRENSQKIVNLFKRGYVSRRLSDDKDIRTAQVSYMGKTGVSEVVSPYGLDVSLPEGIQVLVFSVQAQENNRASMGYSQAGRFKNLESGEVVVGNPITRSFVKFDKDGNITIDSKKDITINSAAEVNVTSSGNVNVDAPVVNLGSGGLPIARTGDAVTVTISGTPHVGAITGGGTNTSI